MWSRHMIDSWASFIHTEYPFTFEVVRIDDQLAYFEVTFLQF